MERGDVPPQSVVQNRRDLWASNSCFSGAITRPQVPTSFKGTYVPASFLPDAVPAAKRQRLLSVTSVPTQVTARPLIDRSSLPAQWTHGSATPPRPPVTAAATAATWSDTPSVGQQQPQQQQQQQDGTRFPFCLAEACRLQIGDASTFHAMLRDPDGFFASQCLPDAPPNPSHDDDVGGEQRARAQALLGQLRCQADRLRQLTEGGASQTMAPAPSTPGKLYGSWCQLADELKHHRLSRLKSTGAPPSPLVAEFFGVSPGDIPQQSNLNRRFVRLLNFQTYIRTQLTVFHSLLPLDPGRPLDDLRSAIVPQLPPMYGLSSRDVRRSKLLSRLRAEGHDRQRDNEEKRRQRLEFLKDVVRHRARFLEAHGRSFKALRRVSHGLAKQFALREKKDLSSDQHFTRERLAALKARDEVQYMKLLREAKNQRLLELVRQTEEYMNNLGALVKLQRENELQLQGKPPGAEEARVDAASELQADGDSYDALLAAKNRYFTLTHTIQEEVVTAPKILKVGMTRWWWWRLRRTPHTRCREVYCASIS